jgi:tetratricopeptide (TPR) repeat protein
VSGQLALVDYYVSAGRPADAKAVLAKLAVARETAAVAKIKLASLSLRDGNRAGAYQQLDEILATEPTNPQALVAKAHLQLIDGKLTEALATARAGVQAEPSSFQAQFVLGTVLSAGNQTEEAIAAHRAAIQSNPGFAPSLVELARLSLAGGRTADALQYAKNAVDAVPSYANAQLMLARAELAAGNTKAAEGPLNLLVGNFPRDPIVQVEAGRLLAARGDDVRARQAFEAGLKTNPALHSAVEGLAVLDVKQKRPDAARARVEAAIKAAPNEPSLHILAARTYSTTGDDVAAEVSLKRAVSLDPNNLAAYQLLANLYMKQRKLPQAAEEFRKVAEKQPRSVYAHTALGLMLHLQNRLDEAMKSYEQALSINPNAAIAANNLAQIYADRGEKLDIALQLAQTAKSALPKSHEVDDTLGWVYYKRKLSDMAISSFKQSLAADPNNAVYHYHLGLAYAQNGNRTQARETLEKALKIQPDFPGADDARKVLQTLRG